MQHIHSRREEAGHRTGQVASLEESEIQRVRGLEWTVPVAGHAVVVEPVLGGSLHYGWPSRRELLHSTNPPSVAHRESSALVLRLEPTVADWSG